MKETGHRGKRKKKYNDKNKSLNPNSAWNPEFKFYWQRLESSTWNLESKAWNPESKTVLDFLTQGESESTILLETDQVLEDFSLDYRNQELTLTLNNKKKGIQINLQHILITKKVSNSVISEKCRLKDRGWFWELSLL